MILRNLIQRNIPNEWLGECPSDFDIQIPNTIYLWLALPIFFMTFILNSWAVVVVLKKEKNGRN